MKRSILIIVVISILSILLTACGSVPKPDEKFALEHSYCLDVPNTGITCDQKLAAHTLVTATGDTINGHDSAGDWLQIEVKLEDGTTGWIMWASPWQ